MKERLVSQKTTWSVLMAASIPPSVKMASGKVILWWYILVPLSASHIRKVARKVMATKKGFDIGFFNVHLLSAFLVYGLKNFDKKKSLFLQTFFDHGGLFYFL